MAAVAPVPASAVPVTVAARPTGAATVAWLASASESAAVVEVAPRRASKPRNLSTARSTRMRAAFSESSSFAPTSAKPQPPR